MLFKAYNVEDEELALKLKALGHVSRLKILATLTEGEKYLSHIAEEVGISRALAKVHLKKLREAGLVETRVVLLEDEARALRFYKLKDFHIELSPGKLKRRKEMNGL
jgi:ArsR family transcriptional regulator